MKTTSGLRLRLLLGASRRLLWHMFRPGYVERKLSERTGKCLRCGACCQLAWKCRYFTEENGLPSCKVYSGFRPPNCGNFPIDHRDLADRDAVFPHAACGFSWGRSVGDEEPGCVSAQNEEEKAGEAAAATAER